MTEKPRIDFRWIGTVVGIGVAAAGAGFLVGLWLGG
jgi:hypothetical protein